MPSPNILIIYTDQQRVDALGANGNPAIKTPHLDALVARGRTFTSHFVQNPVCMPSRASFLTGCYPSTLGITHMGVPLPEEIPNIATLFGRAGYHTANIGKLHFLPHANRDHTLPHPAYGFDHLEISDEPGVYEDSYRAWVRRNHPAQLPHLSLGLPPARRQWLDTMKIDDPVPHPDGNRSPDGRDDFVGAIAFPGDECCSHSAWVGQRTMEHLERRASDTTPFLTIASFYSPHAPWVVPRRFLDLYDPAILPLPTDIGDKDPAHVRSATHGYYAMVSEVDEWCGRIFSTLERTGLADNTIVVFTSDHGEWLGDAGRFGKGHPGDDPVTCVPLVIAAPGIQAATAPDATMVEAIDVLPTLLELSGQPVPSFLQGQTLVPYLRGESPNHRNSALTEFTGWRSLRTESHRYYLSTTGKESLATINPDGSENFLDLTVSANLPELSSHRLHLAQRQIAACRPLPRSWAY